MGKLQIKVRDNLGMDHTVESPEIVEVQIITKGDRLCVVFFSNDGQSLTWSKRDLETKDVISISTGGEK